MNFDFNLAADMLPDIGSAIAVVLILLVPTFIVGFCLSIPVALAQLSPYRVLRLPAQMFAVFFRGVPMLVVLYVVYYGFAQVPLIRQTFLWSFFREPLFCAIFVFTINHAAFLSEIWRGGFRAVPKGLIEASRSLALSNFVFFLKIYMPLAFRYGLSAYRNEIVMFVKSTATVGAIAVVDILAVANDYVQLRFDPFTPLVVAGAVYWIFVQIIQLNFNYLEKRLEIAGQ